MWLLKQKNVANNAVLDKIILSTVKRYDNKTTQSRLYRLELRMFPQSRVANTRSIVLKYFCNNGYELRAWSNYMTN